MAEKAEDLNLPLASVTRIVKDALPQGVSISKEARTAIARAASVFVLYATSTANGFAEKAKRKTLSGADVIEAMKELEFEEFAEPLQQALEIFRKTQKQKKTASLSAANSIPPSTENDDDDDEAVTSDGPSASKKRKISKHAETDLDTAGRKSKSPTKVRDKNAMDDDNHDAN